MTKDDAITHIENLYPPDSVYTATKKIGEKLLLDAICDMWRELPLEILIRLAELCLTRMDASENSMPNKDNLPF